MTTDRPGPTNRSRRGILILPALLAVCWVAYAVVWPQAPLMRSDSVGYVEAAADLRDLRLDQLHDRTFGYPALLVATGATRGPTRRLFHSQLLLHWVSVFFAVVLLRRCGVSRRLIGVFLLVALSPPSVAPACHLLTESLTECLLTVGLVTLLLWLDSGRRGWLVLGSAMLGYAGVVRPTYLLVCFPVALVLLFARLLLPQSRRRLTAAAVAACAAAAVWGGGLVAFNASRFGFPGPTPLLGFNLSTRTVRFVERLPDEYAAVRGVLIAARDRDLVAGDGMHRGAMYIWPARGALQAATGLRYPELSRYMLRLNLRLIRQAPLGYLQEVAHATADFWFPWVPDLASFGSRRLQFAWSFLQLGVVGLFLLHWLLLAGAACLALALPGVRRGLAAAWSPWGQQALLGSGLAIAVILYTMVVSTAIDNGTPRYRVPTDLLLWLVTVLGFELWSRARRQG